jgi:hypothetical protein
MFFAYVPGLRGQVSGRGLVRERSVRWQTVADRLASRPEIAYMRLARSQQISQLSGKAEKLYFV